MSLTASTSTTTSPSIHNQMSEDNIIPFESGLVEDAPTTRDQALTIMSGAVVDQADVLSDRVEQLIKNLAHIKLAVDHARDVTSGVEQITEPELDAALRDLSLVRDLVECLERAMLE